MRVMFVTTQWGVHGGTEVETFVTIQNLKKRFGCDAELICIQPDGHEVVRYMDRRVTVKRTTPDKALQLVQDELKRFDPDVALVTTHQIEPVCRAIKAYGVPLINRYHDCIDIDFRLPDYFMFNAKLTYNYVKQKYPGMRGEVVYPPFDHEYFSSVQTTGYDAEFISMINPCQPKGGAVFFYLARTMKDRKFAFLRGWRESRLHEWLRKLNNVTDMGVLEDTREFYKRTRLLLIPSTHNESFARIKLEAMACEVPCIMSDRGGLSECVERSAIVVPSNCPTSSIYKPNFYRWGEEIRRFDDMNYYRMIQARCKKDMEQYAKMDSMSRYHRVLKECARC